MGLGFCPRVFLPSFSYNPFSLLFSPLDEIHNPLFAASPNNGIMHRHRAAPVLVSFLFLREHSHGLWLLLRGKQYGPKGSSCAACVWCRYLQKTTNKQIRKKPHTYLQFALNLSCGFRQLQLLHCSLNKKLWH